MDILKLIPDKYRFWKRDNMGNVLVGDNTVMTTGSDLSDNTLVGTNTVRSRPEADQPVTISGNRMFGRNKIIISDEPENES